MIKCQCHKVKQAITGRKSKPCKSSLGKEQAELTDDAGIVYFLTPSHAQKIADKYPDMFGQERMNPKEKKKLFDKLKKDGEKELKKRKTKDRWFSLPRVLGAGETKTLTEAVLADLWDLVPVGGDLSNVGRIVAIGAGKGVKRKGAKVIVQSIDAVGGVIPVVGNIIPANTILLITDKVGGRGNPEEGEGFLSRGWAATKEAAKKGARKGAELARKGSKRGAGYLAGKLESYSESGERENPTWPKYIIGLETKESSSVEDAGGYDYDTVNKLLHDPNWQKMKSGQGWEYAELVKIDGFGNETPIERVSFDTIDRDNPARPPKYWWDRMVKEIKASMPTYSMEQIRDTIGDIWYHKLSPSKKRQIVARENAMVPERHYISYENLIGETVEDENGNVGTALGPGDEPGTIEVRFFDTGDIYDIDLNDIQPYIERDNPTKSQAQSTAEWHRSRGKRARVVQTGHDDWNAFVDGKRLQKKKPSTKGRRKKSKPKARPKSTPKKKGLSDSDLAKKIKKELENLLG